MADEVIYTIKDAETGEILCRGTCGECAGFLNTDMRQVRALASYERKTNIKTKFSKYRVERHGTPKSGGAVKTNKTCADCGVLMVDVPVMRQRCPECARKHTLEQNRNNMRRARGQSAEVRKPTKQATRDSNCENCIYYRGEYAINACCNYIFDTGEHRPCPPGDECTVKIERQ